MMPSMRSPLSRLLLVASALVLTAGCASNKRDTYVRERAGEHVYSVPPAELYREAADLLKSKGYSLRENAATFQAVSEWKQEGGGSSLGTVYSRYQVTVRPVSPTSATVVYLRQNNTMTGAGPNESRTGGEANEGGSTNNTASRDLAMEWALLQKVDPQTAEQLQAQAAQANP